MKKIEAPTKISAFLLTHLENVVSLTAQDHDALVEVVVLHGGRRVENGQGRVHLGLESVVRAPMVEVVGQAGHKETQDL